MSAHTDKILPFIVEDMESLSEDSLGHKWGTMKQNQRNQKVCVKCGCATHSAKAKRTCWSPS